MARFRNALAPIDVLRTAEGERSGAALKAVLAADDAPAQLLALLTDERASDCTDTARRAAFASLMQTASAEAVSALHLLSSQDTDLPLYDHARSLQMRALLDRCGCASAEAVEAVEEDAGLANVSDLVRYCSASDDASTDLDEHLVALELETNGCLSRETLRLLVAEARSLCAATAPIRVSATADSVLLSDGGRLAAAAGVVDAPPDDPRTRDVGC